MLRVLDFKGSKTLACSSWLRGRHVHSYGHEGLAFSGNVLRHCGIHRYGVQAVFRLLAEFLGSRLGSDDFHEQAVARVLGVRHCQAEVGQGIDEDLVSLLAYW